MVVPLSLVAHNATRFQAGHFHDEVVLKVISLLSFEYCTLM